MSQPIPIPRFVIGRDAVIRQLRILMNNADALMKDPGPNGPPVSKINAILDNFALLEECSSDAEKVFSKKSAMLRLACEKMADPRKESIQDIIAEADKHVITRREQFELASDIISALKTRRAELLAKKRNIIKEKEKRGETLRDIEKYSENFDDVFPPSADWTPIPAVSPAHMRIFLEGVMSIDRTNKAEDQEMEENVKKENNKTKQKK